MSKITPKDSESMWDFNYRCGVENRRVVTNKLSELFEEHDNKLQPGWRIYFIPPKGQDQREPDRRKFSQQDNVTYKRLDGTTGLTYEMILQHPQEPVIKLKVDIDLHPSKTHHRKHQLKVPTDGGGGIPTHAQAIAFCRCRCILQVVGNRDDETISELRLIDLTTLPPEQIVYANEHRDKTRYYAIINDKDKGAEWHPVRKGARIGFLTPAVVYLPKKAREILDKRLQTPASNVRVVKQPNGRYAVWSNEQSLFILYDQTRDQMQEKLGKEDALRHLNNLDFLESKGRVGFTWGVGVQIMLQTHGEGVVYQLLESLEKAEKPAQE